MTVAPASPRPATRVIEEGGGGGEPDLLDRLRSPATERPHADVGLAGGLRAWLEDGVTGIGGNPAGAATHPWGFPSPIIVRDGVLATRSATPRPRMRLPELRTCLTRMIFRLTLTDGPPRHPYEDALCAISVTERGPEVVDVVRRLRRTDRATLRAFARARGATIASHWRTAPSAWLPRTGERLRAPLAGGAVLLTSAADLVLGRPSDGTASVCLVRLLESAEGGTGERARRTRGALALTETLRNGAPPLRVATYDPRSGELCCDETGERLLVSAVRDVLAELRQPDDDRRYAHAADGRPRARGAG